VADPVEAQRIAPLWKRWIASLLDSVPLVLMALPFILQGRRGRARRPSREVELAAAALSGVYEISLIATTGQTLGQRVVGIRVVDAKTARVPTLRQAVLRWVLTFLPKGVSRLLHTPANVEQAAATLTELQPEIERLTQRHRGDRKRLNEALMALYKERKVDPVEACLPVLLQLLPVVGTSFLLHAPALKGPLHQGLHDRAAGTIVVEAGGQVLRRR
jgi:uncharacterized RDD family membrane protein YckC